MKLSEILNRISVKELHGDSNVEVADVVSDSRKAAQGTLFVAVKGTKLDGHAYIPSVVAAGARAVVCEQMPEQLPDGVVFVKVDDTSDALGKIASAFYGYPSERLTLAGVTGTNGKTTTATLLYKLFRGLGYKAGLLSTVVNCVDDEQEPAQQTTPDPITINRLLAKMVDKGCEYCFMEVSSHSIVQKRISGLRFKLGIFSNITLDHLDYHKTFQEYIRAKKLFFDNLPEDAFSLVNTDDRNGKVMVQNTKSTVKTYGLAGFNDFNANILECGFEGMSLNICGREMWTLLPGKFNAYNVLAVYSSAVLLGQKPEEILQVLSGLRPVAGRFDIVNLAGKTAIVDYAHTPDALENVLNAINKIRCDMQPSTLITLCGCGGDRDRSKRPLMAQIAVKNSDKVILTSDNPRTENPESILDEMMAGLKPENMGNVLRISDRRTAIQTACMIAQKGDIILIAGKGHENYQDVMGVKHHFDDKEIVTGILEVQAAQQVN
ncbi:MAG: UDP-N-acetylmuramoyl-L-alanyl-D-glutamate--2,6-diaminopimelate ligase [Bacteroidales bacterium]|nr:UDP-N-acetylmuramoyl-L-alanyl-D-glutamate--2,6-diaminopimelate ligase [Bacteroidales bacterium]